MTEKLKFVVKEAYTEIFNPFIGLLERILAIWFLIAIFGGIPFLFLGMFMNSPEISEFGFYNCLLGTFYIIMKLRKGKWER